MGAFPFQVTISGVAIPMTPFQVRTVIREDDPVYIWYAPDRQCVGRVTARQRIPFQPGERIACAFDFGEVLDNNQSTITSVNYVQQQEGYVDQGTIAFIGEQVRFTVFVPLGEAEVTTGIEVSITDSKGNVHIADGIMFVTHGDT